MTIGRLIIGTRYLEEHKHGDEHFVHLIQIPYWKSGEENPFPIGDYLRGYHLWFYFWQEAILIYVYWKFKS